MKLADDADERKLRTQLALRVNDLIKEFKLMQTAAANIFDNNR